MCLNEVLVLHTNSVILSVKNDELMFGQKTLNIIFVFCQEVKTPIIQALNMNNKVYTTALI